MAKYKIELEVEAHDETDIVVMGVSLKTGYVNIETWGVSALKQSITPIDKEEESRGENPNIIDISPGDIAYREKLADAINEMGNNGDSSAQAYIKHNVTFEEDKDRVNYFGYAKEYLFEFARGGYVDETIQEFIKKCDDIKIECDHTDTSWVEGLFVGTVLLFATTRAFDNIIADYKDITEEDGNKYTSIILKTDVCCDKLNELDLKDFYDIICRDTRIQPSHSTKAWKTLFALVYNFIKDYGCIISRNSGKDLSTRKKVLYVS